MNCSSTVAASSAIAIARDKVCYVVARIDACGDVPIDVTLHNQNAVDGSLGRQAGRENGTGPVALAM
jgi:hypothetical protein